MARLHLQACKFNSIFRLLFKVPRSIVMASLLVIWVLKSTFILCHKEIRGQAFSLNHSLARGFRTLHRLNPSLFGEKRKKKSKFFIYILNYFASLIYVFDTFCIYLIVICKKNICGKPEGWEVLTTHYPLLEVTSHTLQRDWRRLPI